MLAPWDSAGFEASRPLGPDAVVDQTVGRVGGLGFMEVSLKITVQDLVGKVPVLNIAITERNFPYIFPYRPAGSLNDFPQRPVRSTPMYPPRSGDNGVSFCYPPASLGFKL